MNKEALKFFGTPRLMGGGNGPIETTREAYTTRTYNPRKDLFAINSNSDSDFLKRNSTVGDYVPFSYINGSGSGEHIIEELGGDTGGEARFGDDWPQVRDCILREGKISLNTTKRLRRRLGLDNDEE